MYSSGCLPALEGRELFYWLVLYELTLDIGLEPG